MFTYCCRLTRLRASCWTVQSLTRPRTDVSGIHSSQRCQWYPQQSEMSVVSTAVRDVSGINSSHRCQWYPQQSEMSVVSIAVRDVSGIHSSHRCQWYPQQSQMSVVSIAVTDVSGIHSSHRCQWYHTRDSDRLPGTVTKPLSGGPLGKDTPHRRH